MNKFKNWNTPVKLAISISILAALIFRMDPEALTNVLAHFHVSSWAYATLFLFAQCLLLSLRWKLLLNVGKKHLNFFSALQINLTSQLANLVFITSVGGMIARIALTIQHGASVSKTLIATIFDRLMTLGALVLLSALFLPGLAPYVESTTFSALAGYLSVFIVTIFVFTPLFLNYVVFRLPQMSRLKGPMRYGFRYLKVLMNNPVLCGKAVILSVIAQLAFFVSVLSLSTTADVSLTFQELMTVLPLISLVAALPISIGGWGVREGAFVFGLGLLGVPAETAFLISIQVGLIGMLVTMLAGMPALLTSNLHVERLSAMKESLRRIRI